MFESSRGILFCFVCVCVFIKLSIFRGFLQAPVIYLIFVFREQTKKSLQIKETRKFLRECIPVAILKQIISSRNLNSTQQRKNSACVCVCVLCCYVGIERVNKSKIKHKRFIQKCFVLFLQMQQQQKLT